MLASFFRNLFTSKASRDQKELDFAQSLVQLLKFQSAHETLDALLRRSPQNASALMLRGAVKRLLNDPQGALIDLEAASALELQADQAGCHFEIALCWRMLGDNSRALESCQLARQLDPASVAAFFLLTQLRLPGDYYFDVLTRIIGHLKPRTYVEIGIFEGASLRLAKSAKSIVGIDPDPKIDWKLEPNMHVFKMTSDSFFESHDLASELGQRSVDLAFIDGMHQFEFAMRDFANIERCCRPDSVILIHDCYPLDEESAGREPRSSRWSGDVWRLIVLLKKYRQDLLIHTIGTAPTGLAVIQNLDPASTFLLDNQVRLFEEFIALEYSYLDDGKPEKLNLFPNHWPAVKGMIRPRVR
ncbi:class I SAM-dependent methyltransferase [Candidatus Aalborgicola defluviihabitans]|jgi:tetratricopeptide (TPR) repeat protein|uniref:class I SAM-dependent methyltransferase n=1 Tax=Candidatus Aalborgicola defluviihabitans TaxID=3386187 RepID=UPI001DF9882C|nr:class I SAM-dependent methyltransferase [Burkholderiales bacterium]